jgi:O-antigen/teichoic acid export membrane protein
LNPLKQLAGQTAIYGLSSVIARILNFLLVPFYTRIFTDTAEYGIISELYAYVAFFIVILTYGMETAFFRFSSKSENKQLVFSTSLISLLVTSFLFALTIIFLYPSLAQIIGYGDQRKFVLLLGLILSFDAIAAIPFARLRLENKALKFALIKLFNISANILFNILFLVVLPRLDDKGYNFYLLDVLYDPGFRVGYVFVSNFLASLLTLFFFMKHIINNKFVFSWRLLKSMLFYSFPLLISGLAGTVNEFLDRVMLRHRLPGDINALEQIGIYGANVKIAVLMALFIQMFRYASEPFFFSQEKNQKSRELYADILYYFTIFGIFVFLVISLYLDLFIHILGSEYHEGAGIVPVILMGYLMLGIYFNLSLWYKLTERTLFGAVFAVCGAMVTIVINYFFIPGFGYMASAWGHLAAYTSMVLLAYFTGRMYFSVPYNIKGILLYLVAGIGLYLLSTAFKIEDIIYRLTLNTIMFMMFTLIVFYREKKLIMQIIKYMLARFNT